MPKEIKNINSENFRKMIFGGEVLLEESKEYVDSLNVFPVPDGDTGTNMGLTLKSAVLEVGACTDSEVNKIAEAYSRGALKGARGNSGVILSQIIKGFCEPITDRVKTLTTRVLVKSLKKATDTAYKAVTKPQEGTILTVMKAMSDNSEAISKKTSDVGEFLKQIIEIGEETLKMTPEMLPVLKKAGVVDAGGRGLLVMFNGFYRAVTNDKTLKIKPISDTLEAEDPTEIDIDFTDLGEIEFGYCTEFMVIQIPSSKTQKDIEVLKNKLMEIGDSVICVGDLNFVKVHVHTNEPNKALQYALELGEFNNLKIDNMRQQNRELIIKREKAQNLKPFGMVAVAPGKGLGKVFEDLGVDSVIKGGQTMNPSAEDILRTIEKVPAKEIFVFPNNKNIIMAAQQANNLTKKQIFVIPTKSVPEGIAAALIFDPSKTAKYNVDAMMDAKDEVLSGAVTYAVRDAVIDDMDLKKGDIIGLTSKNIVAKGNKIDKVVEEVVNKMVGEDSVNITLFYGDGIKKEDAEQVVSKLEEKFEDCDVIAIEGSQPIYHYLISVE